MAGAGEALELDGEGGAGERAAGEDGDGVFTALVERGDFFAMDGDVGCSGDAFGYAGREEFAVNGKGVASGDGGGICVAKQGKSLRCASPA